MTKWLAEVERMLKKVPHDYLYIMSAPLKEGEQLIGVVPPELRPLWGLCRQLEDRFAKLKAIHYQIPHDHNRQNCSTYLDEKAASKEELRAIRALFYTSLKHEVHGHNGVVDVRGEYQVVTWEQKTRDYGSDESTEVVGAIAL